MVKSPTITDRLLVTLCLFLVYSSPLLADETSDSLKALRLAMEEEAKQQQSASMGNPAAGVQNMILLQLKSQISQGDPSQIAAILNQLSAYFKTEAVMKSADRLKKAMDAERAAKEEALRAEVDTAISAAGKAIQGSKTAADLDGSIDELSHLQGRLEVMNSGSSPQLMNKLRNTRQFVISWQDYLSNRDAGNKQQALQTLQNIAGNASTDLIPRSQVLDRINQLSKLDQPKPDQPKTDQPDNPRKKIQEILDKTTSLDAIPAACEELSAMPRNPSIANSDVTPYINSITTQLSSMYQSYREFKAGLPAQVIVQPNFPPDPGYVPTMPLRMELLRLVLPQFLRVDEKQQPLPGETVPKYLARMMDNARQTADAKLISRIYQVQTKFDATQIYGSPFAVLGPLPFLEPLLAAQNQQEAGQFVPAVVSYEVTLKTGGDLVPAEAIGKTLDEIKKEHPEDYEQGMKLFLANTYPTTQSTTAPVPPPAPITVPGSPLGNPSPSMPARP